MAEGAPPEIRPTAEPVWSFLRDVQSYATPGAMAGQSGAACGVGMLRFFGRELAWKVELVRDEFPSSDASLTES